MVSVAGKGRDELCQVGIEETNESEPLMTCRKFHQKMSKPGSPLAPGQGWAAPADGPIGIRHKGGVTSIQALVRNLGTCRPDAKGEIQAEGLRKGESTDAGHRGGDVRSRVEGSVMGSDRRGVIVRLYAAGNPQGEDLHG